MTPIAARSDLAKLQFSISGNKKNRGGKFGDNLSTTTMYYYYSVNLH